MKKYTLFIAGCLALSFLVTGLLILFLAFLAYKCQLSEGIIRFGIMLIYVISTFIAGYVVGKKVKKKKFLFGLAMGMLYFAVLLVISIGIQDTVAPGVFQKWACIVLCGAGGMCGGMIS